MKLKLMLIAMFFAFVPSVLKAQIPSCMPLSSADPTKNFRPQPGARATYAASMPEGARPRVSAALGRNDSRYRVRAGAAGFVAENPQQSLSEEFSTQGLQLRAGKARFGLALQSYGYGDALHSASAAAFHAGANRVDYRRGALDEWYVNGPAGLEQGFTLRAPLGRANGEPLTIAMGLSGGLSAEADADAKGLSLMNADGELALRYAGLVAADASGRELPSWLEVRGQTLLVRVDVDGARYPVTIDPFMQQAKLTASDGAQFDHFGTAVGLSEDGNTLMVGAEEFNSGEGAVYVFTKPAGGWSVSSSFVAKLTPSDGGGLFGESLALSRDGSTLVVGAQEANVGLNSAQGAAYVFVKPGGSWTTTTESAKLTESAGDALDESGTPVSVSNDGSTITFFGADKQNGAPSGDGAVYIFVRPSGGWSGSITESAILTDPDPQYEAYLGIGSAISGDGNTIAAASFQATVNGNAHEGRVYVFLKPSGGWVSSAAPAAVLTASDDSVNDNLGRFLVVSNDGSTVVAAKGSSTLGGAAGGGTVYVFQEPTGGWTGVSTEAAQLSASSGGQFPDSFGISLALSTDGNRLVVGENFATVGPNCEQGDAYVFVRPAGGWVSNAAYNAVLSSADGAQSDFFGASVGISSDGTTIAAGANAADIGMNVDQGAAYIFVPSSVPTAMVAPPQLNFGNQTAGVPSAEQTVTLTNTGSAALNITNVAAGGVFATTTNCLTASPLGTGGMCMESVTFTPTSATVAAGSLTFTDDSNGITGSTQSVPLSGTGVKANTVTNITGHTPSPSQAGQAVTVSYAVTLPAGETLTPTGTVTVTASSGEICSGAPPSGSCQLTFLTTGSRTLQATYSGDSIFNGSPSATVTQNVTGAAVSLTPASVTFGTLYPNQTTTRTVTLKNTGTATLSISSIKISTPGTAPSEFSVSSSCPSNLAAGKSCSITVRIQTSASVLNPSATLAITDNAFGSPQLVPLSATVINPKASLNPAILTFATQKVSTTSTAKTVTLTNTGTTTLIISTVTISGNFAIAAGTTCVNGAQVAAGTPCVIKVTFTPLARGIRTGAVKITDNAQNSPQAIGLVGTAN